MGKRVAVVLLLLLAACGEADVPDTDCTDPNLPVDRVRFASMVLVGTAKSWDGTTAQFEIDEIWRGPDLPREIEIVPEPGRVYSEGVRYLLFPTDSPSPLADARCSATVRWTDELAELRPERTRGAGATPAQDADLPWEWVIAAAVLFGAYAATRSLLERRRHPAAEWDPHFSFEDDSEG